MFGPPGMAYVYFTYGMHFCMNAVTDVEGKGSAVLLRALEPVWGVEEMRLGAPDSLADAKLASGPGRICRALGVDKGLNGADLSASTLRILPAVSNVRGVRRSERIGLSKDDGREWRYFVDSPSVSGSRRPGR